MKNKNLYIIAGPNGSGKTTFAKRFLPKHASDPPFVNVDFISLKLSPLFSPRVSAMKAGRLALNEIQVLSEMGSSLFLTSY